MLYTFVPTLKPWRPMQFLAPSYRIREQFCRSSRRHRNALPIPWAVRVPNLTMARDLLDALEQERVRSGEVVVAADGKVYVRWSD
jgi:hypothetical protein